MEKHQLGVSFWWTHLVLLASSLIRYENRRMWWVTPRFFVKSNGHCHSFTKALLYQFHYYTVVRRGQVYVPATEFHAQQLQELQRQELENLLEDLSDQQKKEVTKWPVGTCRDLVLGEFEWNGASVMVDDDIYSRETYRRTWVSKQVLINMAHIKRWPPGESGMHRSLESMWFGGTKKNLHNIEHTHGQFLHWSSRC